MPSTDGLLMLCDVVDPCPLPWDYNQDGCNGRNLERGFGEENLGSSSQALESSLDVSLTQQKVPGGGPHQRKDLGPGSWREGAQPGRLFCEVPDGWTRTRSHGGTDSFRLCTRQNLLTGLYILWLG